MNYIEISDYFMNIELLLKSTYTEVIEKLKKNLKPSSFIRYFIELFNLCDNNLYLDIEKYQKFFSYFNILDECYSQQEFKRYAKNEYTLPT